MNLGTDISTKQNIKISIESLRKGLHISGKPGQGKSALIGNIIYDALSQNIGLCFLDPHGDQADAAVDGAPDNRFWHDLIYWEPFDTSHIIGYNPLKDIEKDKRPLVAQQIFSSIMHAFRPANRRRTFYDEKEDDLWLYALLLLLENQGVSLMDIPRLIEDDRYRLGLLRRCQDDEVRGYWTSTFTSWDTKTREQYCAGLLSKMNKLAAHPALRAILQRDDINPKRLMEEGKALIVNLSKGKLGDQASALLGALLTGAFAQGAYARADIPEEQRRDFALVIDEFQNFTTTVFTGVLSEARKYRLSLVVANQYLSQLPEGLQDAILGTVGTLIAFKVGPKDATVLAPEFGLHTPVLVNDYLGTPFCDEGVHMSQTLTTTPRYTAWFKTEENKPIRIATYPPRLSAGRLEAVREHTRARYGKPTVAD